MKIEITIMADSVEEVRAAFTQLAGERPAPHVTVLAKDPRVEGGELTIPAGTDLTVAAVSRDSVTLTSDPAAEPMKAPEKPKRTRKAAAKAPESTQAAAVAQEVPQPEQVTPEPEKPAETTWETVAEHPAAADIAAEAKPAPTRDQIAAAGARLLDADPNAMQPLLTLLGDFGVQAITQLKDNQLPGFADRLRALGAEV